MTYWDVDGELDGKVSPELRDWVRRLVDLGNEMRSVLEDDERSDEPTIVVEWLQHVDGKDWR